MSTIQVTSINEQKLTRAGRYLIVAMTSGKHSLTVMIAPKYVQVIVENAANRAWRGMGKQFPTMADAIANYKTADIRAMLEHAGELNTAALQNATGITTH